MAALRNLDTGLFYTKGQWTHDAKFAQCFENMKDAEKVVRQLEIKNADFVTLSEGGCMLLSRPIRIAK